MRALIGFTGFVGSNLWRGGHYDCLFNSKNANEMRGRSFAKVVCAGVSAVKWKANKDPAGDWAGIQSLIEILATIRAEQFVLISTVDVYQNPVGVTEADEPSLTGAAYGANRVRLERWVADRFGNQVIVRLPALFGPGLKKNAIYDLQHDNMVENINSAAKFQWYDVTRLEADMEKIVGAKIPRINITSEPILMKTIGDRFFPGKLSATPLASSAPSYDVRTLYAACLGGSGPYHFDANQILAAIQQYLAAKP